MSSAHDNVHIWPSTPSCLRLSSRTRSSINIVGERLHQSVSVVYAKSVKQVKVTSFLPMQFPTRDVTMDNIIAQVAIGMQ